MKIYDLKTNSMKNPMGISKADFSWKIKTDKKNSYQSSYRITVCKNAQMTDVVWDSGVVNSQNSLYIPYEGEKLESETRYFWQVSLKDGDDELVSDAQWFETGLMGEDEKAWNGARWIGKKSKSYNSYSVFAYKLEAWVKAEKTAIAINARNKDNCVLAEIDMRKGQLNIYEICDNAWKVKEDAVYSKALLGTYPVCDLKDGFYGVEIKVDKREISVSIDGEVICENQKILPETLVFNPKKDALMNVGICQSEGKAYYRSMKVTASVHDCVLKEWDFEKIKPVFGEIENGALCVSDCFELLNPSPSVNVKREFNISKEIKSARLYATALGFYNTYINCKKTDDFYYKPGFTDYRKRVQYQSFDVTNSLKKGENTIIATVTKGYYTGFCGYSGAMIYGTQNSFMAKLVIRYTDGSEEIIVTDEKWQFTDMGPVVESDYLDGEIYDSRISLDNANWEDCGVYDWNENAEPTNGKLSSPVKFRVSPEIGEGAKVRVRLNAKFVTENPKGHFIYDCGQNITGTISLRAKAKRGMSIKIRYGEMCCKSGEIYVRNLRSAANTDIYTFGTNETEEFIPSYTAHGFRYIEITGNGFELTDNAFIESIDALNINNIEDVTGEFECSSKLLNQLHSNILWGQRDNYLLVPTDCPQRNERQGWTGDMQVFAATAAYNMDVKEFTRKWLTDLEDAQELYNKNGAVPDTAPLGGDNRPDGCAGWGDAAVIVPWEMYMAYGDKRILTDCYDMMTKWVDYQCTEERQNCGERIIDGKEAPSDLAKNPYIQVQQRRGDHLTFDETTPFILTATAYAAYVAHLMSKIAEILGKKDDEITYKKRFDNIKRAFNEAWVKEDSSISYWGEMSKNVADKNGNIINKTRYSGENASQTAYSLALRFGLIDEKVKASKLLKKSIENNQNKLSVGFLGIAHLLYALSDSGLNDEAFSLLLEEGYPGWLYSVKNGATTIWERWDSYVADTDTFGDVAMNSFNHYAYGACGEWMYRYILGISPKECGYKEFYLAPHFGGNLSYAKGKYETPYGEIVSGWEQKDGKFIYNCTVPDNTTAYITLPDGEEYSVGSGSYSFEVGI